MPYAANDGLRIHYEIDGDGPPLVLQHGFTSSMRGWYEDGFVGTLKGFVDGNVVVDVDGREFRIPHAHVSKANIEPQFD